MIVINTAKGVNLFNENEVKSVKHRKKESIVEIMYKDGSYTLAYQVESVCYTNKTEIEVKDNGLILGSVIRLEEYYKKKCRSAEDYVKHLVEKRNELEGFINSVAEHPDSDHEYRDHFIKKMREEWKKRPGNYEDELSEWRTLPYHKFTREELEMKGDELENEFKKLTKYVENERLWTQRYKEAIDRLMARSLWQRIINKETYL